MALKNALEACLFGVGLPGDQGLLLINQVIADGATVELFATSVWARREKGTTLARSIAATSETRRTCAFMQGLVAEGVSIRDLLFILLDIQKGKGCHLASPTTSKIHFSCPRTCAEAAAAGQAPCDIYQVKVAGVIGAFVEWLVDRKWGWGAVEGGGRLDWRGDIVAVATAIASTAVSTPVFAANMGVYTKSTNAVFDGERINQDGHQIGSEQVGLLDRLVAGAAVALGHAEVPKVEWVSVLAQVIVAADTASLRAYAVNCVENSVALGGQAPFKGAKSQRISQADGKALWGLLEQTCMRGRKSTTVGTQALVTVLIRVAAAAIIACQKARYSTLSQSLVCKARVMFG